MSGDWRHDATDLILLIVELGGLLAIAVVALGLTWHGLRWAFSVIFPKNRE